MYPRPLTSLSSLPVDAAFLQSCVQQKLDFQARVHDVLQGAVKPSETLCKGVPVRVNLTLRSLRTVITQCCIQALYDAGAEGQAAVDLAKGFERRKCNHFKSRPEDECMATMAGVSRPAFGQVANGTDGQSSASSTGKDNPNRYVVATQSLELRKKLRAVPGLPLVYINRSVMLLETPSDQTMQKKSRVRSRSASRYPSKGNARTLTTQLAPTADGEREIACICRRVGLAQQDAFDRHR